MRKIFQTIMPLLVASFVVACNGGKDAKEKANMAAPIFPDYKDIVMPCNMAAPNFEIKDAKRIKAIFSVEGKEVLEVNGTRLIEIPLEDWKQIAEKYAGKELQVFVSAWTEKYPDGVSYNPFSITIDSEPIDNYIAYRLIPPGYEEWNRMGIFQRELGSYEQSAIVMNTQNNNGCVNCHSFANMDPQRILFHARGKGGGTIITDPVNGIKKIDLTSMGPELSGTYPMWHPSGKYVAFSANTTRQAFLGHCLNKIEVYDLRSDIIIYDVEKEDVLSDSRFLDSLNWETFPTFSPDGKWLYFCTAKAKMMPLQTKELKYSIIRVPFDENSGKLGEPIDTIYSAYRDGGSVSFPRISPDGRYLLYTWASCATFPIQHREADLRILDLQNDTILNCPEVNSPETDSYHSWSSTGKWIIFSSRRVDNRYTRLFIAPFRNGKFGKPFLLPQRDPEQNTMLLYSYNIPEFIKGKVELDRDKLAEQFRVN